MATVTSARGDTLEVEDTPKRKPNVSLLKLQKKPLVRFLKIWELLKRLEKKLLKNVQ